MNYCRGTRGTVEDAYKSGTWNTKGTAEPFFAAPWKDDQARRREIGVEQGACLKKLVEMISEDRRDGGPGCDDYSEMSSWAVRTGCLHTERWWTSLPRLRLEVAGNAVEADENVGA